MNGTRHEIMARVCCRECGEVVADTGDRIQAWPSDRFCEMPARGVWNLVVSGRVVAAAKCSRCDTVTLCSHAARAWTVTRWRHTCSECGGVHDAVRERILSVYRGE